MGTVIYPSFIQHYAHSANRPGDSRCGDSWKIAEHSRADYTVFACSDGVGGHAHHYEASNIACDVFINAFLKSSGEVTACIHDSVMEAHRAVRRETNGANATLVAAVYCPAEKVVYYISIGDSAIFLLSSDSITKLTVDDSFTTPIRFNNKLLTSGGVVKTASGLSKALGQEGELLFDIKQIAFRPGEAMVLATDGIHNNGPLSNTIHTIVESADVDKSLAVFVDECSRENNDDATAVLLISNDYDTSYIMEYVQNVRSEARFPLEKHSRIASKLIAKRILDELAVRKEWEPAKYIFAYLATSRIFLPKQNLISYLNQMIGNIDDTALNFLKTLIRQS